MKMAQDKIFRYDLMDIVRGEAFYNALRQAGELTQNMCESSFNVYGDQRRFTITIPLEEYTDDARGGPYIVKGKGLYTPQGKNGIIVVHFHTPNDWASPSPIDLKTELIDINSPFWKGKKYMAVNKTNMVGHRQPEGVYTIFCSQFINDSQFKYEGYAHLQGIVEGLSRKLQEKKQSYSYEQLAVEFPFAATQLMQETGVYRATVLRFSNREEYDREREKLQDFTMFVEVLYWA